MPIAYRDRTYKKKKNLSTKQRPSRESWWVRCNMAGTMRELLSLNVTSKYQSHASAPNGHCGEPTGDPHTPTWHIPLIEKVFCAYTSVPWWMALPCMPRFDIMDIFIQGADSMMRGENPCSVDFRLWRKDKSYNLTLSMRNWTPFSIYKRFFFFIHFYTWKSIAPKDGRAWYIEI